MATTYDSIISITIPTGGVASLNISNIPQNYTDLVIVSVGTHEAVSTGNYNIEAQFNGDTSASNYRYIYALIDGTTASSARATRSSVIVGSIPGTTATGVVPGATVVHLLSYSNTNMYKTALRIIGGSIYSVISADTWASTSAINSIRIFNDSGDIAEKTNISIYGIKAA